MKAILNRLINHETISRAEAREVLVNISGGHYNQSQIAAFLTVYMMRSITLEEISGFRDALLELCIATDLRGRSTIDLCGTGGDGKDTFNISTLASFVTAGAGVAVSKHGNYGVSSTCGSSNVLEYLGITFSNEEDFLNTCLDKAGICILHAPLFHPAMKQVAPIRRELGVKTFFNMLGPMVNPANPDKQMVGVFNLELARLYGYLYQNTEKQYTIVHSLDGYDEIALTGPAKIISNRQEQMVEASHFATEALRPGQIRGGKTIEENAAMFMEVLQGTADKARKEVVCANAALAIATATDKPLSESMDMARESLNSGAALSRFKVLQSLN